MTAVSLKKGRDDFAAPAFSGTLRDHDNCVELSGVLRPSRLMWLFVPMPFVLLAIGLLSNETSWPLIGLAMFSAPILWGLLWINRQENDERRNTIVKSLTRVVTGHA